VHHGTPTEKVGRGKGKRIEEEEIERRRDREGKRGGEKKRKSV
jgi:hypothetical protein